MSLQSIKKIRDALLQTGIPAHHYEAPKKSKAPYLVWAEEGADTAWSGDNKIRRQTINGTVDFFTLQEFDPRADQVQEALGQAQIPYRLLSIQKEEDTGLIHYEWEWEIIG